jgi:hypothetical protein
MFQTILSLAIAGTAAMVPEFIDIQVSVATKLPMRTGGALAVFVIVFFFNAAELVVGPVEGQKIERWTISSPPFTRGGRRPMPTRN